MQTVPDVLGAIQVATQRSWKRPFGVGLLVAGYDQSGAKLFYNCPSGNFYEYKAFAIGARSQVRLCSVASACRRSRPARCRSESAIQDAYTQRCVILRSLRSCLLACKHHIQVASICKVHCFHGLWLGAFHTYNQQKRAREFCAGCKDVPGAQVRGVHVVWRGRAHWARAPSAERVCD